MNEAQRSERRVDRLVRAAAIIAMALALAACGHKTRREPKAAYDEWEKACRQRWRALALCIKAKLEAVECGITTFESEFLAHIVLPSGETMADRALPYIAQAYETNSTPPMISFDG